MGEFGWFVKGGKLRKWSELRVVGEEVSGDTRVDGEVARADLVLYKPAQAGGRLGESDR